jgi:hypothetical protein
LEVNVEDNDETIIVPGSIAGASVHTEPEFWSFNAYGGEDCDGGIGGGEVQLIHLLRSARIEIGRGRIEAGDRFVWFALRKLGADDPGKSR